MAAFSIACTVRVAPYFFKRTFQIPFFDQMCEGEYEISPVVMFWLDVFVITKPIEFLDTLFIVLRKQHLVNPQKTHLEFKIINLPIEI